MQRIFVTACAALFLGCHGAQFVRVVPEPLPIESDESILAEYVVNPPDVLVIDVEPSLGGRALKPGDEIIVDIQTSVREPHVVESLTIGSDGTIKLPPLSARSQFQLPALQIGNMKINAAQQKLAAALRDEYPSAIVSLFQSSTQSIFGQFLVRPDGTVKVGMLPSLFVAGKSLSQIEALVKAQYGESTGVSDAKVSVDVLAYNSLAYYIIADGGGFGDQVQKLPFTGRENVLDALAEVGGMPNIGSRANIWISRPVPGCPDQAKILPVHWEAIVKHGQTKTNYQIMPGDRIFIKSDRLIATDNLLSKLLSPLDRVLGTISLFSVAQQSASGRLVGGGAGAGGS